MKKTFREELDMSVANLIRAYTQPLDQQDGSPLLHSPSPMHRERKPRARLAEGLRMSPANLPCPEAPLSRTRERLRARTVSSTGR